MVVLPGSKFRLCVINGVGIRSEFILDIFFLFFFLTELALWPGEVIGNHPARDRSPVGAMGAGVAIHDIHLSNSHSGQVK